VPCLSGSAVVIHYEEALYQVYTPLRLPYLTQITNIKSIKYMKYEKHMVLKKTAQIRKHSAPKIFVPPQTPLPGAQDGQNLISWIWSLPSPKDPVW